MREEVEELVADKEMECATYEAALDKVLEEAERPLSDEVRIWRQMVLDIISLHTLMPSCNAWLARRILAGCS